ncbi:MurR/RpiR family transcriptional regulator [Vibrio sp.]|uniref:MurR/RpiR family transcriptional regulator n=1 Tax=Vibrio viridaestus TaxID=2487322 RepID=A0A3N9TEP3_9VIBR|nr:MurR/RpiR family transcriptional regulator [Vibrio viridaestus]MDC0611418.1 MurR/RpiR family transcriptional regulator [Vibrio sp.]RQW62707.1 MurR/RpiR family transcriptional regulator [Vibrio viridaestus]
MAVTSFKHLQHQIHLRYNELSTRLQQVAKYLLENKNTIAFNTLASISREADVPPSAITRFSKSFGFKNFNEMKVLFREHTLEETSNYSERLQVYRQLRGEHYKKQSPTQILQEFAHYNAKSLSNLLLDITPEELDKAIELIQNAKNIYVVGNGRSFGIASYLTYALSHLGCRALIANGLGGMLTDQVEMYDENDLIFAISFSPYSDEAINTMLQASERNIKQIVITDQHINQLTQHSDVSFVIKEASIFDVFRSLSATQCLVQTLSVAIAQKYITEELSQMNQYI